MHPDSPYTLELLEDYVNGLLSSEGKAKVEKLIAEREEVAMIVQGIEALKEGHGSTDSLRDLATAEVPDAPIAQTKVRSIWPRMILVAASVAVLVVAGFFFMQNPSLEEVLAQEVAEPYSLGLVVRGVQGEEIGQAYEAGNFEKVYTLGKDIPPAALSPDIKLQMGISSLKTGRTEESLTYLDANLDNNPLLGLTNKWYRALALTALQDANAIPLLQAIETSGGLHSASASELLDAIDREWK